MPENLAWTPRSCGEATTIPGCSSIGSVSTLFLPSCERIVIFIGSSDCNIYALRYTDDGRVMAKLLVPKRADHERIQSLVAVVACDSPKRGDCVDVVALHLSLVLQTFSIVVSRVYFCGAETSVNEHVAMKNLPDVLAIRLFHHPTLFSHKSQRHDGGGGGVRVLLSAVEPPKESDVRKDEQKARERRAVNAPVFLIVNATFTENNCGQLNLIPWKNEENQLSPGINSILSVVSSAICSLDTVVARDATEMIVVGCVNGEVVLHSSSKNRTVIVKRLCGPISDVRLFSIDISISPLCRSKDVSSLLSDTGRAPPPACDKLMLLMLDTAGCVQIASDLNDTCTASSIDDQGEYVPLLRSVPSIISLAASPEASFPATLPVGSGLDMPPDTTFHRVKAALMGTMKRNHDPRRASTADFECESTPLAVTSDLTWPRREQQPAAPEKFAGTILSRGLTSLCVADLDGDGTNELIFSTMGRSLVYCKFCPMEGKFIIRGKQAAPSQMYFMTLMTFHRTGKQDLLVMCGPRHVLITQCRTSNGVSAERLKILQQLISEDSSSCQTCET